MAGRLRSSWCLLVFSALFSLGSVFTLSACQAEQKRSSASNIEASSDSTVSEQDKESTPLIAPDSLTLDSSHLLNMAQNIMIALSKSDYIAVSRFTDKDLGLRFSPYAYLAPDNVILETDFLANPPKVKRFWGRYDGSGDSILLSFSEYHKRFVYDRNFVENSAIVYNAIQSHGNSLNNLPDLCRECIAVSYFQSGTEHYGGMDWRELKLVFRPVKGAWKLYALVHDQWTS